MDELLRQLITEVCQHPLKSLKRRKAMNRLLVQIQQLPGLWKSSHSDYLEALNQTFEWVSRKICQDFYLDNPLIQKRLVQWINSYLRWRIKDLYSPDKRASLSLDATIGGEETETTFLEKLSETGFNAPTRSGFDAYIEQIEREQQQFISLALEGYIEEDPEGKLGNCHPKARPDCNCQLLTQRLLLKSPPDKLAGIAKDLGIKDQTLYSHWKRNCLPLLQEVAKELGYQPEP